MITTLRNALLASAFALAATAPALAVSTLPHHAVTVQYQTRLVPQYGVGEYDGTMRLTLNPDGIINGLYIPDSGSPRVVTGGMDSNGAWLDLGFMGTLHVTGAFARDWRFVGDSFSGDRSYRFYADVRR